MAGYDLDIQVLVIVPILVSINSPAWVVPLPSLAIHRAHCVYVISTLTGAHIIICTIAISPKYPTITSYPYTEQYPSVSEHYERAEG